MDRPTAPKPQLSPASAPAEKQRWVQPEITDLPRLTELTLLTGSPIPGGGGTGGGGGTVF
ncbi:MAG: hypothetical protein IH616_13130 [Gemmatimonadales bacterium]|nr:hypothetical protein [Gemmatimonadales bacterium]